MCCVPRSMGSEESEGRQRVKETQETKIELRRGQGTIVFFLELSPKLSQRVVFIKKL